MYIKKKRNSVHAINSNSILLVSQAKNTELSLTPLDSRICKEPLLQSNKKKSFRKEGSRIFSLHFESQYQRNYWSVDALITGKR